MKQNQNTLSFKASSKPGNRGGESAAAPNPQKNSVSTQSKVPSTPFLSTTNAQMQVPLKTLQIPSDQPTPSSNTLITPMPVRSKFPAQNRTIRPLDMNVSMNTSVLNASMINPIETSFSGFAGMNSFLNNSVLNTTVSEVNDGRANLEVSLWFTNLLMLGFDVDAQRQMHGIEFDAVMFRKPNEKGMQVVLYFLFCKLEPIKSKEMFASIWPVFDKNQARDFKKLISNRLGELEKSGKLPQNTVRPSDIQTASGRRFYQLLDRFSTFVVKIVVERDYPSHVVPILKHSELQEGKTLLEKSKNPMELVYQIHLRRESQKFLDKAKQRQAIRDSWKKYDDQLQQEIAQTKEELAKLRIRSQQLKETVKQTNLFSEQAEMERALQGEKLQQLWREIENTHQPKNVEMLSNVLHEKKNPNRLEQRNLMVNVPRLQSKFQLELDQISLLQNNKLSLEALIQVWNVCIKALAEHLAANLSQQRISELQTIGQKLSGLLQTHESYKSSLEKKSLQLIETISKLQMEQLQTNFQIISSNQTTKNPISFAPPTPVSFMTFPDETPDLPVSTPYKDPTFDFTEINQSIQTIANQELQANLQPVGNSPESITRNDSLFTPLQQPPTKILSKPTQETNNPTKFVPSKQLFLEEEDDDREEKLDGKMEIEEEEGGEEDRFEFTTTLQHLEELEKQEEESKTERQMISSPSWNIELGQQEDFLEDTQLETNIGNFEDFEEYGYPIHSTNQVTELGESFSTSSPFGRPLRSSDRVISDEEEKLSFEGDNIQQVEGEEFGDEFLSGSIDDLLPQTPASVEQSRRISVALGLQFSPIDTKLSPLGNQWQDELE